MAYLKVENIHARNDATNESLKLKVYVSADGEFYCYIPEEYLVAAQGLFSVIDKDKGKIKICGASLDALTSNATTMLRNHITPEVTEENVIQYNIESHVSFAVDGDGLIHPNAGYDGANWPPEEKGRYGDHHAASPARGGYNLTIGARAMTKTTYKYGDSKKVEYKPYYKGEHHLSHNNPAQILNSWCSFRLPAKPKEIPYTDEAALFFHDMMMGMARLSQMIQGSTFDQSKLLELIESGSPLLLGSDK